MTMCDQPTSLQTSGAAQTSSFQVTLPVFHSVIGLVGLMVALVLLGLSLMADSYRAATVMGVCAVVCLLGVIDAVTARLWIANDHIWVRRWGVWVKSFSISDVVSVAFDPGEYFEIQLTNRRHIGFPGGGQGLAAFTDALTSRLPQDAAELAGERDEG